MSSISIQAMQDYLSKSVTSSRTANVINLNKLYGILAEVDFRNYLGNLGYSNKVSVGGWIARNVGPGVFGHHTAVFFPDTIMPNMPYSSTASFSNPSHGLHTICATFHQIGIHSYFCTPVINRQDDTGSIQWHSVQLGLPTQQNYQLFPQNLTAFTTRQRRYSFLTYNTDVSSIPPNMIPEEFSKEHLRVTFQSQFLAEISDVDGIFWGDQYTYPIEIKEKTAAQDSKLGNYFGLDLGPFVKLAFYAAKRGNLHSIFIVREIDDTTNRNLVDWWFITFEHLAQYASWVPQEGGMNMLGGRSSVVKIPKSEFTSLSSNTLSQL